MGSGSTEFSGHGTAEFLTSKKGVRLRVKIVAVIGVFLTVVILTGCGGGAEELTTEVPKEEPPGKVVQTEEGETAAVVEVTLPVPREFKSTDNTPKYFKEALDEKKPVLLMFYSDKGIDSLKQKDEIKYIFDEYQNDVIFMLLSIEEAEKTSQLADEFNVGDVPHISIIDPNGQVIREFRGSFVDGKVIEQIIYDII